VSVLKTNTVAAPLTHTKSEDHVYCLSHACISTVLLSTVTQIPSVYDSILLSRPCRYQLFILHVGTNGDYVLLSGEDDVIATRGNDEELPKQLVLRIAVTSVQEVLSSKPGTSNPVCGST
jgi:hypothetical protein